MSKGWSERLVNMEALKVMDLESMKKYVEDAFSRFMKEDLKVSGKDLCEADLTYYYGYFACARDLGLITEDREEYITDKLTDLYNALKAL